MTGDLIGNEWQGKYEATPRKSKEEREGIAIGLGAIALLFVILFVTLIWRLFA